MSYGELITLLPFLVLFVTLTIALVAAAFNWDGKLVYGVILGGLALAFGTLILEYRLLEPQPGAASQLLIMDKFNSFYIGLILSSAFVVVILIEGYFSSFSFRAGSLRPGKNPNLGLISDRNEMSLLLLLVTLATLGSAILVASTHFASFFLGLEILSVSLYTLISFQRNHSLSLEAGIKYLILSGTSSAFLLLGIAMIYASLGEMHFTSIRSALTQGKGSDLLVRVGGTLFLVGVFFKLALTPFHTWSPDIYQGASAPVAAFVGTASKGAVFALLLRYSVATEIHLDSTYRNILAILATASMVAGNFLALRQNLIKRLLAYSSIAQLGYLVVPLLAGDPLGLRAASFYLVTYLITILIAFGVIALISKGQQEVEQIQNFQGLFWEHPFLAFTFSASLLSLAGIPPTSGFIGKFYLISSAVSSALWGLVIILLLSSAIAIYYYLRVITIVFTPAPASMSRHNQVETLRPPRAGVGILVILMALLIGLGIYPSPFLDLLDSVLKP